MFDRQAVKLAFGRAAAEYDAQAQLQRQVREHGVTLAEDYWKEGAAILDAGCGTGAFAQETGRWRVTGLDMALGMCREAQGKHAVVNADAAAMPFADGSFDGLFSSLMLQWANDPTAVWREMARVVRRGGVCVVSTLVQGTLQELREAFAAVDDAPHVSEFLSGTDVVEAATQAGFQVIAGEAQVITEHYVDMLSVMHSLKAIGAGNKHAARRRGMMTPRQMERLAYKRDERGLPVTWRVMYLTLGKL